MNVPKCGMGWLGMSKVWLSFLVMGPNSYSTAAPEDKEKEEREQIFWGGCCLLVMGEGNICHLCAAHVLPPQA